MTEEIEIPSETYYKVYNPRTKQWVGRGGQVYGNQRYAANYDSIKNAKSSFNRLKIGWWANVNDYLDTDWVILEFTCTSKVHSTMMENLNPKLVKEAVTKHFNKLIPTTIADLKVKKII